MMNEKKAQNFNEIHNDTTSAEGKLKAENMGTYLNDVMSHDIKEFINGGKTKSGYDNLDAITNLYPGLYVLGAISSLGKTTFMHQMADQLAQRGQHVLFFSLEQSILELASKSLSRIMAKDKEIGFDKALTSLQIRKSGNDERISKAVAEYMTYSSNLTVVECTFRATIEDIVGYINLYIQEKKVTPIVIVDYLQVIQTLPESHMTTKDAVDLNVRRLKQVQSDNKLVLFVVSSLNRQNYLTSVDFESFKESGGIEYTADVVWGLQLQCLHEAVFDKQNNLNEKRNRVKEAKAANPRKVELVCLKNRFGISSYNCRYDYYPQFDFFKADMTGIPQILIADSNKDRDGWMEVPNDMWLPFND